MSSPWLIKFPYQSNYPMDDPTEMLARAGGKGANLIRLAGANFPVPRGFIICTAAYREFVSGTGLTDVIRSELDRLASAAQIDQLEEVSARIRSRFSEHPIQAEICQQILEGYEQMGTPVVAVRSSATAEDLPDLSFAGQQDTFLGILGADDLLNAVRNCWSSLWTARAIGYRQRNAIGHEDISLAVVIQEMVPSEVSGVLFTANPLTGLRNEVVIDACFGLGEALVSGKVEPDHYVVDQVQQIILQKTAGKKQYVLHSRGSGGTQEAAGDRSAEWALADEMILKLADLGAKTAQEYQSPQDIEWALADGKLYLLQSRAITSLFPIPQRRDSLLRAYFSFGAVQGYLEPFTPYGMDMMRQIFAAGASMYGYQHTSENQPALVPAGGRLWVDISNLIRNTAGRKVLKGALRFVEPTISQALEQVWDDPRFLPEKKGIRFRTALRILRFLIPIGRYVLLNILHPAARRSVILSSGEALLRRLEMQLAALPADPYHRLEQSSRLFKKMIMTNLPPTFRLYVSGVAAGMASWNWLRTLAEKAPTRPDGKKWSDLVLEVTRGMAYNPTTEMDLRLWEIASELRGQPDVMTLLLKTGSEDLARMYLRCELPAALQGKLETFLKIYGSRGLGEIDAGTPRWRENPVPVLEAICSFVQIEAQQSPDLMFQQGAKNAGQAVDEIYSALRGTRLGWLKARLARFAADRMRNLMGLREHPKFFAVRLLGLQRSELLSTGAKLVELGTLDQADDLMFLTQSEQERLGRHESREWKKLISERREMYVKEKRRRSIPRLLLSDGRAIYDGMKSVHSQQGGISGSPVSPGVFRGQVRIVYNPHQAGLLPGEVLVCRGTDPSWTPLFMSAGALIMEVGGMMTHGAVVAREYGIPAVVGVDRATERFITGQWVEVDGSNGRIVRIEAVEVNEELVAEKVG